MWYIYQTDDCNSLFLKKFFDHLNFTHKTCFSVSYLYPDIFALTFGLFVVCMCLCMLACADGYICLEGTMECKNLQASFVLYACSANRVHYR